MFAYEVARKGGFRAAPNVASRALTFALLGISVTAARRSLEPLVKVRILDPQYVEPHRPASQVFGAFFLR